MKKKKKETKDKNERRGEGEGRRGENQGSLCAIPANKMIQYFV